jgi:DNA-damage-inducible protein J
MTEVNNMKDALVQVRVEDKTKSAVDTLFAELGLDTATAIRIFLAQALQVHGLPFEVKQQPRYNAETEAAMREADEIASGERPAETFASFAEYRAAVGL